MNNTWWMQLEDLDSDQKKIISLGTEVDSLVVGPPGSGKTNLLLLRASFLGKSGHKNFCVLTLGRVLTEFLISGAGNYDIPPNNIKTYFKWARDILRENGLRISNSNDFETSRAEIYDGLLELSDSPDAANMLDFLLIDEVQDYTSDEISLLRKFTKYTYAVGDSKQRIYVADDTMQKIKGTFKSYIELKFHYRNGINICKLADGILNQANTSKSMEATSHYEEHKLPSSVKKFPGIDLADQVATMLDGIADQLLAYPGEQIGVITPRKEELSEVVSILKSSSVADLCMFQSGDESFSYNNEFRIVVGTIHSTKGMEFRACHFVAAEKIVRFPVQKKMAFTACTRAKTSLSVYHSGNLPNYFEQGFVIVDPIHEPPELKDLFPVGGGS